MNKTKKTTLIICFSIYAVLILIILLTQHSDTAADIGLTGILLGLAYFLFGLISMVSKESRNVGAALLISAGIIFLIGFSVCSMNPVKI
jgi:hypothetical protein